MFTPDNSAIVLIDHQDMTVGWIRSLPREVTVANVRMLARLGNDMGIPLLVTMEDHVVAGGFGSAVLEALHESDCPAAVERLGWPDKFVEHGSSVDLLRAAYGLSPDALFRRVVARWRNLSAERIAANV